MLTSEDTRPSCTQRTSPKNTELKDKKPLHLPKVHQPLSDDECLEKGKGDRLATTIFLCLAVKLRGCNTLDGVCLLDVVYLNP